jgi:hypothetical protein
VKEADKDDAWAGEEAAAAASLLNCSYELNACLAPDLNGPTSPPSLIRWLVSVRTHDI